MPHWDLDISPLSFPVRVNQWVEHSTISVYSYKPTGELSLCFDNECILCLGSHPGKQIVALFDILMQLQPVLPFTVEHTSRDVHSPVSWVPLQDHTLPSQCLGSSAWSCRQKGSCHSWQGRRQSTNIVRGKNTKYKFYIHVMEKFVIWSIGIFFVTM